MKNQYFGDLHDYLKYAVLRVFAERFSPILIAWMLTPDDRSSDGRKRGYLKINERDSKNWRFKDPRLYECLSSIVKQGSPRVVKLAETHALIAGAHYFSDSVPKDKTDRNGSWMDSLIAHAEPCPLVFLDPDNGIEIRSVPKGRKRSEKYVYWDELECLWNAGKSILIYQHFPRQERTAFIEKIMRDVEVRLRGSKVNYYKTGHVLFLLAIQESHLQFLDQSTQSKLDHILS